MQKERPQTAAVAVQETEAFTKKGKKKMKRVVEADPALVEQANYEALKLEEALQIAKEAALKEKRTQTASMVQQPIVI